MKKFLLMSLVLVMLAATLVGCGGGATYEDGTHTGEAEGFIDVIKVSVEVTDGAITNVEVTEHQESDGISDPAIEQIPAAIVEKGSTDVDAVSGATGTSNGIKAAVDNALGN